MKFSLFENYLLIKNSPNALLNINLMQEVIMAKSEPSIEELSVITIEKMRADMIDTKYNCKWVYLYRAVDSCGNTI